MAPGTRSTAPLKSNYETGLLEIWEGEKCSPIGVGNLSLVCPRLEEWNAHKCPSAIPSACLRAQTSFLRGPEEFCGSGQARWHFTKTLAMLSLECARVASAGLPLIWAGGERGLAHARSLAESVPQMRFRASSSSSWDTQHKYLWNEIHLNGTLENDKILSRCRRACEREALASTACFK